MTDLRDQLATRHRIVLAKPHEIHAVLAQLRKDNHHTQRTLAAATGFKDYQISQWEIAGKRPNLDSLIRLAGALGYRVALIPQEET